MQPNSWVEGISTGRINNHRVGEILARLIQMELAPLKRFTTQVYESMYKRSTFHNQQLEALLTEFIGGLPDKPVTGLKTTARTLSGAIDHQPQQGYRQTTPATPARMGHKQQPEKK